jgi:hypothetical protein
MFFGVDFKSDDLILNIDIGLYDKNVQKFFLTSSIFQLIFFHGLGDQGHGWADAMKK